MGADAGVCESPGSPSRLIHLGPGTYDMQGLSLAQNVSLLGDGEASTVVEGTVLGLRTGSSLSNLTVTKGTRGGIVVSAGESPQITSCTISGNSAEHGAGGGVYCGQGAIPTFTSCAISGNSAEQGSGGGGVHSAAQADHDAGLVSGDHKSVNIRARPRAVNGARLDSVLGPKAVTWKGTT